MTLDGKQRREKTADAVQETASSERMTDSESMEYGQ